jgi:hypothetical protein
MEAWNRVRFKLFAVTCRHSGAMRSIEPGIHAHDGGYGLALRAPE